MEGGDLGGGGGDHPLLGHPSPAGQRSALMGQKGLLTPKNY